MCVTARDWSQWVRLLIWAGLRTDHPETRFSPVAAASFTQTKPNKTRHSTHAILSQSLCSSSQTAPPAPPHWPTPRDVCGAKRDTAIPPANTTTDAAGTSRFVKKYTAAATRNSTTPTTNARRPSRSRSRNAGTTRKGRRATSARRPSTGKRRRASCVCVRAAGRRASRTCRVWRSRRRFCLTRSRRTIFWALRGLMRGGRGGTRAACASNGTTA